MRGAGAAGPNNPIIPLRFLVRARAFFNFVAQVVELQENDERDKQARAELKR